MKNQYLFRCDPDFAFGKLRGNQNSCLNDKA